MNEVCRGDATYGVKSLSEVCLKGVYVFNWRRFSENEGVRLLDELQQASE